MKLISNIIQTLLAQASMPLTFLHHALPMTIYLFYILTTKVLNYQSSTQILNPGYSNSACLSVFGCLCFLLHPASFINKLQERSTYFAYLGPSPNHHGSKCYDMSSEKFIIYHQVCFVENEFYVLPDSQSKTFGIILVKITLIPILFITFLKILHTQAQHKNNQICPILSSLG